MVGIDIRNLELFIDSNALGMDASEFHGMVSGLICAGVDDDDVENWLPILFSEHYITEEDYKPIENDVLSVYFQVLSELNDTTFSYSILLPDDDQPLEFRVEALGSWCRGFRRALIDYGEVNVAALSEYCAEFIQDVESFIDIEIDENETKEELDTAFLTIEEHLRVGVQLLYETKDIVPDLERFSR